LIKKILKRYRPAVIAYCMYQNYRARRRMGSGNFETGSGTHGEMTVEENVRYVNEIVEDYLHYAGLKPEFIKGKTVLEIGPGDNFGVALKLLAQGAERIVCLDRFYSKRDDLKAGRIYAALRGSLLPLQKEIFDRVACMGPDNTFSFDEDRLKYVYGRGVEEASTLFPPASFDLIVSRAVLEHVYDPGLALESMRMLMTDKGIQLHKIDLRDHGMFSGTGMHPLTFLTIPDIVWKWMTSDTGGVNRARVDDYREKMRELGFEARIFMTSVMGRDQKIVPHEEIRSDSGGRPGTDNSLVNSIRPRLARRFRDKSPEDLMISGIFVAAKKFAGTAAGRND
jgi:Methyltransferase domain